MKRLKRVSLLLVLCLLSTAACATNLRGRVEAKPAYAAEPFPARGVSVELYQQNPVDGKFTRVSSTVTGVDGLYYFKDIQPGTYYVQVAHKTNYRLVVGREPYQEIAPIRVTY